MQLSESQVLYLLTIMCFFPSLEAAIGELKTLTNHVIVSGGGKIYKSLIDRADTLHISRIDAEPEGNFFFPEIPKEFTLVFEQKFHSNINYRYQIGEQVLTIQASEQIFLDCAKNPKCAVV